MAHGVFLSQCTVLVANPSTRTCGCVFFVAELRVRPPGDSFTKPVGGSVVMTCSLEIADGDTADDEIVLSWLDDSGQEVSSVTGRYEVTIP